VRPGWPAHRCGTLVQWGGGGGGGTVGGSGAPSASARPCQIEPLTPPVDTFEV
jgi:hypothetical protein